MRLSPKKIQIYLTPDGKAPFRDWLSRLKNYAAKGFIRTRLDRVAHGNLGDHRPVGGGVHEMRIHVGPGYRVYFGLEGDSLVLLLWGGDKGSQTRDIAKAKEYWLDFRRHRENTPHD